MAKPGPKPITRWVVLLRGVNVGGSGRTTMAALRAAVHDAGYADATTYLQTGNVLLGSHEPAARIAAALEHAVAAHLGFATHAIVRSAEQMAGIARPAFLREVDAAHLAVAYCKTAPAADAVAALGARDFAPDTARPAGSELYLSYPHGMGRSKMSGATLERVLGVPITVRNWKVTCALADLASAER